MWCGERGEREGTCGGISNFKRPASALDSGPIWLVAVVTMRGRRQYYLVSLLVLSHAHLLVSILSELFFLSEFFAGFYGVFYSLLLEKY